MGAGGVEDTLGANLSGIMVLLEDLFHHQRNGASSFRHFIHATESVRRRYCDEKVLQFPQSFMADESRFMVDETSSRAI